MSMGRLSSIKPRLSTLPPRIGAAPAQTRQEAEAQRLRQRDKTVTWRSWYKTARWRKLREEILKRDLFTCQMTGVLCIGKYPSPNSPVVDHKIAHRGDEHLFWDEKNLHCVSKSYHDSEKQKQERQQGW